MNNNNQIMHTIYDEELVINNVMTLEGGIYDDVHFKIGFIKGKVKMLEMSWGDINNITDPTKDILEAYLAVVNGEMPQEYSEGRNSVPVLKTV